MIGEVGPEGAKIGMGESGSMYLARRSGDPRGEEGGVREKERSVETRRLRFRRCREGLVMRKEEESGLGEAKRDRRRK